MHADCTLHRVRERDTCEGLGGIFGGKGGRVFALAESMLRVHCTFMVE